MSKVAGIKRRSPETYPNTLPKLTILETLSGVEAGPVALNNASFTSILATPIMFAPAVDGAKAVVLFSGVLENASAPNVTTVAIIVDLTNEYEVPVEVQTIGAPIAFSLTFETGSLGVAGPHTIDVQAKTAAGTSAAIESSIVVIVTSA